MSEFEQLKNAKTLTECGRIIYNTDYINGRLKEKIIEYCRKNYDIDIQKTIFDNKKHYCLFCGKEITSGKKFCNNSCAAKYNNKGKKHTEETKKKITETLRQTYLNKVLPCQGKRIYKRVYLDGRIEYSSHYSLVCKECGKEFYSKNKRRQFCCPECAHKSEIVKEKLRLSVEKRKKDGTFSGWQVRNKNVSSYAEKFWERVLDENSIQYIREDYSTKKYFLDFLIKVNGKKIDLEIDGKQHQHEERKKHDAERDKFLSENGFIVYRVQWNKINDKNGQELMKEKIEKFLSFYRGVVQ